MLMLANSACIRRYHQDYGHRVDLSIVRKTYATSVTWNSDKGQVYTVMYLDKKAAGGAPWTYHPKAINIMGTGGPMTFTDDHPAGTFRRYRLELKPVTGTILKKH